MHLDASPTRVKQIKEETAKDEALHSLRATIPQGWPDKRADCPTHLHAYWNYSDQVTVSDGLILKGTRSEVLKQLHYACSSRCREMQA